MKIFNKIIAFLLLPCWLWAQSDTSDWDIKATIAKYKPANGAKVPSNIRNILGATHCNGRYYFTKEPFLIEGARKLDSMGYGVLKLWLNKAVKKNYPFNSEWEMPTTANLVTVASHPYYKQAMSFPFSTIVLTNTGVGGSGVIWKLSVAALEKEEKEIYALSKYLLETYKERKVDFIIQNWEGDWLYRGGSEDTNWKEDSVPNDIAQRSAGMIAWFNARQKGVERARTEVKKSKCRVLHAVEVNKVMDCIRGIPGLTSNVLPQISPDLVSWSSYDGLDKEGIQLYKGVDYIRKNMNPSGYLKGNVVYIGEIGIPEEVANNKNQQVITERWDNYMGVLLAQKVPYIIQWELYCNEPKTEEVSYLVKENEKMRGFWLIRPDGTPGFAQQYFNKLLK